MWLSMVEGVNSAVTQFWHQQSGLQNECILPSTIPLTTRYFTSFLIITKNLLVVVKEILKMGQVLGV